MIKKRIINTNFISKRFNFMRDMIRIFANSLIGTRFCCKLRLGNNGQGHRMKNVVCLNL